MPRNSCSAGDISNLLDNNRRWIQSVLENDPEYFSRYKDVQKPQYFWIGCSDSRVVAEAALGLGVGDLFVHRNVGNCISHYDQNAMSALEYSVKVLKVGHVLVCGHENCGAVKAALTMPSSNPMLTNCWISQIRDTRNANVDDLAGLNLASQVSRLVQLHIAKQVFNVCTSPVIQQAWENGEEVFVHGLVFDVATGELRKVVGPYSGNEDVPEDSADLDADSLAPDSPMKMKKSRSLAGVMNKLGEKALQDLEDSECTLCDRESTHGVDASEAHTWGTSTTRFPTRPSSSAASQRGHDDQDEGGYFCEVSGPSHDANERQASMLFDSASDPLPHTDAASPQHATQQHSNTKPQLHAGAGPHHPPSTSTATQQSLSQLHEPDSGMLPPGPLSICREASAAPQAPPARVCLRSSTNVNAAAGEINDLPRRLSKQMSFHTAFENVAKLL